MDIFKHISQKNAQIADDKFIIFLLTMSHRADRTSSMKNMLKNIIDENQLPSNFNIIYGTPFPYNNIIINAFNTTGKGRFTKPNEYDCSRNHYSIIKQAYDLGYSHVLVMEDDICFLNNINLFIKYIENIPNDYDIIQFGGFTANPAIEKYLEKDLNNIKTFWVKHKDVGIWNTSMYMLSRKGMEFYLTFMDKLFWVADGPLYKAPINDKIINTYLSTIPLVIQADKNIVASDIRDEKVDTIDYNKQNLYEQYINKENYFKYVKI